MPNPNSEPLATMSDRSSVSLIVPLYNVAAFVGPCVRSLQAQTFRDFDVVIVNDGSTDESAEIARSYVEGDSRFLVVDQANHGPGPGGGRNGGLRHTRSDRLMFLDSDDALMPDALGQAIAAFDRVPNLDIVSVSAARLAGASIRPSHFHDLSHPRAESDTTAQRSPWLMFDSTPWNKVFRREFFDRTVGTWPERQLYEDIAPMTNALLSAEHIAVLDQQHYLWRVRGEGSITHTQAHIRGDLAQALQLDIARNMVVATGDDTLLDWFDWKSLTQDLLWMTRKLPTVRGADRTQLFDTIRSALLTVDPELVGATLAPVRRCYDAILRGDRRVALAQIVRNRLSLLQDRRPPGDARSHGNRTISLRSVTADADGLRIAVSSIDTDLRGATLEVHDTPPWVLDAERTALRSVRATRDGRLNASFTIERPLPQVHNGFLEVLDRSGARSEILRSFTDALRHRLLGSERADPAPLVVFVDDGRVRVTDVVDAPRIGSIEFIDGRLELTGVAPCEGRLSQPMRAWLSRPLTNEVFEAEWDFLDQGRFRIRLADEQLDELNSQPHALSISADDNPAIPFHLGVAATLSCRRADGSTVTVFSGVFGQAEIEVTTGIAQRLRDLGTELKALAPARKSPRT